MLKQTVHYKDFNDNDAVDNLYFNLTKAEVADNFDLADRFQGLKDMMDTEPRDLTRDEIRALLDLVKEVMRLSYGVKSDDGKRFSKKPEVWEAFIESAAYDAFLMSLFEQPEKANAFLIGVFPPDLIEQAKVQIEAGIEPKVLEKTEVPLRAVKDVPVSSSLFDEPTEEDKRPLYQRENRNPTQKEMMAMSHAEMVEAMQWRTQRD